MGELCPVSDLLVGILVGSQWFLRAHGNKG